MKKLRILGMVGIFMPWVSFVCAQEYGFLQIVNMVPQHPACRIQINDQELLPHGLHAVSGTGWFMIPQGNHRLALSIDGLDRAKGQIEIAPQASVLCVIFLQQIDSTHKTDGTLRPPKLRIKRYPATSSMNARALRILSLCPEEEIFRMGEQSYALKPLQEATVAKWSGVREAVMHRGKVIGISSGAEEIGHYTLLLASDHRNSMAALLVRTDPQELPPWHQKSQP